MLLDDVDYLVDDHLNHLCKCHSHLVLSRMSILPRASRTPLISTHASYRLAGERGGTRGAGRSIGAGTSGSVGTRRGATGVPGS